MFIQPFMRYSPPRAIEVRHDSYEASSRAPSIVYLVSTFARQYPSASGAACCSSSPARSSDIRASQPMPPASPLATALTVSPADAGTAPHRYLTTLICGDTRHCRHWRRWHSDLTFCMRRRILCWRTGSGCRRRKRPRGLTQQHLWSICHR